MDSGVADTDAAGGLSGRVGQFGHGGDLPPRVLVMPAFSDRTKGALASDLEGSDGSGPIQRGAVSEYL